MAACNFSIHFSGPANVILQKAESSVTSQGGTFTGDASGGNFELTVFGNTVAGSYSVDNQDLNVVIDSKPFMVPCSAIEGFLKSKIS